MALSVKAGSFAANTSTGNQAVTGVGFQPKAILFSGSTSIATGLLTGSRFFFGAATSTSARWCHTFASDDAAAASNTGMTTVTGGCIVSDSNGTPTVDAQADFVSFDSDGFTVNWSDAPATASLINYYAIGGTTITNAKAGSFTFPSGTGSQGITGVGFQPDFMLFTSPYTLTGGNSSVNAKMSIGAASSGSREFGASFVDLDAANDSNCIGWQKPSCLIGASGASADFEADLTAFAADGLTLNVTTANGSVIVYYLALKGGRHFVGPETMKATTGTKATTGVGFQPSGLLCFTALRTADSITNNTSAHYNMGIGFASSTTGGDQKFMGVSSEGGRGSSSNTNTARWIASGTVIASVHSDGTDNGSAALSALGADGFTLNYATASSGSERFGFWAIADAAVGGGAGGGIDRMMKGYG